MKSKKPSDSSGDVKFLSPAASDGVQQAAFLPDMLDHLEHWIVERESIRQKRAKGKQPPWTDDPVLFGNRFCNVRRMDDKVSDWLLRKWYQPNDAKTPDGHMLVAATLARHINRIESLAALDFPSRWQPEVYAKRLRQIQQANVTPLFTGAYIIHGGAGGNKIDQVVQRVQAVASQSADMLRASRPEPSAPRHMELLHAQLQKVNGIGSFIAGQIVADLRFTSVLRDAPDGMLWAPRGPGSTRGMNRLLGSADLGQRFRPDVWQTTICALWRVLWARPAVRRVFADRQCELMDLQNCLCEFDKYIRVLRGEGRAKNHYTPKLL